MMPYLPWMHNLKLIEETDPTLRYREGEDFFAWQIRARAKLSELLGFGQMKKADDRLFTVEYERETDEYTETRFTLQSEEGYIFPAVIRIPKGIQAPMPVMLTLQGHSTGMHISLGNPIFERDYASISGGDRDFTVRALKEGCAAVAIEQRNFGECGGDPEKGKPQCWISSMSAIINGRTTIGERVLDVMCVIDVLTEHFSMLDPARIMLMGNSGGGTTTIYAAAMDERISLAMPSCSVCTYKTSIAAVKHCVCNFVPNIVKFFDMGDLCGLVAPRPLVIVNGLQDHDFPNEGVKECYDVAQTAYTAAGVPDRCQLVTGPEGHRFYADLAWPIARQLMK